MSTSSSCVSMKRGPFESLVCGQETASIEGAPPWMREPRRWGFSVSRSEYFQVSAITVDEVVVHRVPLHQQRPECLEQREVPVDLDGHVQVGDLGPVADHALG